MKIFDYVTHCLALGMEPIVYCPERAGPDLPLFSIDHLSGLLESVRFEQMRALRIEEGDLALFSWPAHYELICARVDPNVSNRDVIHLVQNTRHANPHWQGGYATRLLTRPLTRIMVADQVREACEPFVNPSSLTTTIVEGHNWEYFSKERAGDGLSRPIRVGYTTWKSDVGCRVEAELEDSANYTFRHIAETVGWKELRNLYQWCDVFLATPGPQEGFYLPGLEAMAAGALLITPDVEGNMQYCEFGVNALGVAFEDTDSYIVTLKQIAAMTNDQIEGFRQRSRDTVKKHSLQRERQQFADVCLEISDRKGTSGVSRLQDEMRSHSAAHGD